MAIEDFNQTEFEITKQKLLMKLTEDKIPEKKPQAFLLGGQAGAGKTTLHTVIKDKLNDNVIVIDNDSFKTYHPNYYAIQEKYGKEVTKKVTPFSNRMTEELITELSQQHYNLVIEGTLRTTETPLKTNKQLKNVGYTTNLYVMSVPFEVSYLSTLSRYEMMTADIPETARFTPKSIQQEMVKKLPDNLDKLIKGNQFSEIRLYNRDKKCLYNSSIDRNSKDAKQILQNNLSKKMSTEEALSTYSKLTRLMENNHHEKMSEYQSIKNKISEITQKELNEFAKKDPDLAAQRERSNEHDRGPKI